MDSIYKEMRRDAPFGRPIALPAPLGEAACSFHVTLAYLQSCCDVGEVPVGIYMNKPTEYRVVVLYAQRLIDLWYSHYTDGRYADIQYRSVPRVLAMQSQGTWRGEKTSSTLMRIKGEE